jgi:hypothetical protein
VTRGDVELKLGPTEFRLLHFLMAHPERVHSRAQLLDRVWGDHVFIEERTVDVHVKRLREALARPAPLWSDRARRRLPVDQSARRWRPERGRRHDGGSCPVGRRRGVTGWAGAGAVPAVLGALWLPARRSAPRCLPSDG